MNKIHASLIFVATLCFLSGCQDPSPDPADQGPTPIVNQANAEGPGSDNERADADNTERENTGIDPTETDSATDNTRTDGAEAEWIMCPEQRPEMCAHIYRPVCGLIDTGLRCVTTPCPSSIEKTFGNACSACAEPRVDQYRNGECKNQDGNAG